MRTFPAFAMAVAVAQQGPPAGERINGTVKSVAADSVVLLTPRGDVTVFAMRQSQL